MGLLATACLLVLGLLAAAGLGIWFARETFLRSLGLLAVHLAVLVAGHYLFGIYGFVLMFSVPLLFSAVLGGAAGSAHVAASSWLARLAPLAASLPAVGAINAVAIAVHLDELGPRPRGDNALIYVFAQVVFGLPLQMLLLAAGFLALRILARSPRPA